MMFRACDAGASPPLYLDKPARCGYGVCFPPPGPVLKIVETVTLISAGSYPDSAEWKTQRDKIHKAIEGTVWPPKSGKFTIYPESGKKSGKGNGVKPIKAMTIDALTNGCDDTYGQLNKAKKLPTSACWVREVPFPPLPPPGKAPRVKKGERPGKSDLIYLCGQGLICFEWETGNISSSHRSLNKMAQGLMSGDVQAGVLVVPSCKMAPYLTDRIGNIDELRWYFPLWKATPCDNGVLEIIVIEQDAESLDVPKIPKGTDGLAAYGAARAAAIKL
jgi:hypothetical protein